MRNWREAYLRWSCLAACAALMATLFLPMPGLAASIAAPERIELTPALEASLRESIDLSTLGEQRRQRSQQQQRIASILLDAERASLTGPSELQGRVPLPAELLDRDRILVEIWHSGVDRSFHSAGLSGLNATVRHQGGNGAPTEAWVPASRMSELAALPGVNRVAPARLVQHLAGAQNTQGVNAGNVPPWHAASLDGDGVTIAIIDSFNNTSGQVAALQASGDWPPSSRLTTVKVGTGSFGNNGVNHGNAVLEIAYDVAPGANFIAYDTRTLGDWRAAIDQAVTAGANIISASLGAPLDGIGDGTALPGSVAERVEAAAAAGVLYFNAAGNEREAHWGGLYAGNGTSPGSGYVDSHNWGGGNVNYMPYCLPTGFNIQVTLHWDDWTSVDHDYDLFLLRYTGSGWTTVAVSDELQNGGSGQTPQEFVSFSATGSSPGVCSSGSLYGVIVARWNAPTNKNLQLFAPLDLLTPVAARSLGFPADSPAAITVAAIDVATSAQESYSSEGPILAPGGGLPTGSEFPKPDFASFANVNTVSYGVGAFNGTSAATPHAAGMAALLKQRHPGYTRNQLVQLMRDISAQGANDLGASGFDFQHGQGRLRFQQESALVVTQQPVDTDADDILPEVRVEVRDTQNLRVLSGPTTAVAVAIEDDPSGGTAVLSGTSPATVDAGIASYPDLSIDVPGADYTLSFTAAGLGTVESAAFDILATAIDGACGSAHGGTFTSAPATDLCAAGTPGAVGGGGPWTWTCAGVAGGTDASCSADIQTYTLTYTAGAGGSLSGATPQTVPHGSSGSAVTATPDAGYSFTQWSDGGTANPRTDTNVTANITVQAQFVQDPVDGACGSAHGGTFTSAPATNLCAAGTPGAVGGSGPWTWTCAGIAGGTDASCSADIQTYTLTYTTGSGGSISGSSPQTVPHGGSGTPVEAVPDSGYQFVQWSDSSTGNPRTDTNVTATISVAAEFEPKPLADFTPGNVVVYRVGDGTGALAGSATRVFLDEIDGTTGALVQSIPLPIVEDGANKRCTASGTATAEGMLSRSADRGYLVGGCYDQNLGGTAPGGTRLVFRAGPDASVDTTTALADITSGAPRTAASTDGDALWVAGNNFTRYANHGGDTSTSLNSLNARVAQIFDGQLYVAVAANINAVGNGLPTSGPSTSTPLTWAAGAPNNIYGFFFADLSEDVEGLDTLYIARDDGGAIAKYSKVDGAWAFNNTVGVDNDYRGLTGEVNGGVVTLFTTRTGGSPAGLFKLVDSAGYNAHNNGTIELVHAAAANTAYRGVAFAPEAVVKHEVTSSVGSGLGDIDPLGTQLVTDGFTTEFTVTPAEGWHVESVTGCGGVWDGDNPYTTAPISADCDVIANFAQTPVDGVCGSASGGTFTTVPTENLCAAGDASAVAGSGPWTWTCGGIAGGTDASCSADIQTYTLTYTAGAGGSISGATPQTVPHGSSGSAVTATPDAGYSFTQWSDGGTANPRTDTNVTANITVQAQFVQDPVDGACGSAHGGTFTSAPATNLCAAGTPGAVSGSGPWTWTCGGIAGGTDASCSADIQTYTLTYTAGSGGSISGTTPQTVPHGSSGSAVTATPDAGYSFTQWSDGGTANPRTDANVTANITVQAQFTLNTHAISVNVDPVAGGTASCSPNPVEHGGTVVCEVNPAPGWSVDSVSGDTCTPVDSGNGTWTASNITESCAIAVTFRHSVLDAAIHKTVTHSLVLLDDSGDLVRFEIIVGNAGMDPISGAEVLDLLPEEFAPATWTCEGISGGVCTNASGTGDIAEFVDLPVGAAVRFVVEGLVAPVPGNGVLNTAEVVVEDDADASDNTDRAWYQRCGAMNLQTDPGDETLLPHLCIFQDGHEEP